MMKENGGTMKRRAAIAAVALTTILASLGPVQAGASTERQAARYRVRHGGKVALDYFESERTFEGFDSRKAKRLESNLEWIDHRRPTDGAQVDVAFTGERRLLLITRTLGGRWFCTVTSGDGTQTAGRGPSFSSVDSKRECIKA
jgi:hypothetical protein